MNPTRERWLLGALVLLGVAGSLLLALTGSPPTTLPGIALGSHALLTIEKATAAFTAYLLVLVVVVRAFAGDLPSELRGLKYAVETGETVNFNAEKLWVSEQELRERISHLESVVQGPTAK